MKPLQIVRFENHNFIAKDIPTHVKIQMEELPKESIESAVIQKVNEFYNQQINSFDDLILFASDISKKKQINEIINNLKICDPAVGSGHFLVSALNRIISIKSELGVLFFHNENRILNDYDIRIGNDILTITDGNGDFFTYNRASSNSFKVQNHILRKTSNYRKLFIWRRY